MMQMVGSVEQESLHTDFPCELQNNSKQLFADFQCGTTLNSEVFLSKYMLYANTANATGIGASARIGFSMQIDYRRVFAVRFAGVDAGTLLINTFV